MDASGAFGVADESEVGIFAFTCHDFIPIGGVIKEAPEDFRVWELRRDGYVVRIDSANEVPTKGRRWAGLGGEFVDPDDPTGDGEEWASRAATIQSHDDEMSQQRLAAEADKHTAKRQRCASESDQEEPKQSDLSLPMSGLPSSSSSSLQTACKEPYFLKFALSKRCIDTLEALGALATALNVKVASLGFAGIKDSVAVTCQEVTIPRWLGHGSPDDDEEPNVTEQLVRKAAEEVGEHLRVGNFCYTDKGLWPGQLTGNRFRICIRRATFLPPNLSQAKAAPSPVAFDPSSGSSSSSSPRSSSSSAFLPPSSSSSPSSASVAWTCACGSGGSCSSSCSARKRRVAADCTRSPDVAPRTPFCCPEGARLSLRHALQRIADRGFVNFIGMQRFGKGGVRSDLVGLAYLQQDYEKCIDLILFGPPEGGVRGSARSIGQKRTWRPPPPAWAETFRRTWSADSALRAMPKAGKGNYWIERRLLTALKTLQHRAARRAPEEGSAWEDSWYNQCRTAFLSLPFAMRKLYTFAYLDRLWNICASERVAKCPTKAMLGDLVWADKARRLVKRLETPEEVEAASVFDVLLPRPGRAILLPGNFVGGLMQQYIRYDLDGTMDDLAIDIATREPDPDHRHQGRTSKQHPPNAVQEADSSNGDTDDPTDSFADLAVNDPFGAEEDVDIDDEDEMEYDDEQGEGEGEGGTACDRWKINGDYRPLLCQPANLRWAVGPDHNQVELRQADHPNRLRGRTLEEGLYRVTLSFDLPRGTYATMFLRELCFPRNLRTSSSSAQDNAQTSSGKRPKPAENAGSAGTRLVWSSDEEDDEEPQAEAEAEARRQSKQEEPQKDKAKPTSTKAGGALSRSSLSTDAARSSVLPRKSTKASAKDENSERPKTSSGKLEALEKPEKLDKFEKQQASKRRRKA